MYSLLTQHVLVRLRNGHATLSDWKAIYKTAYNGVFIGDLCRSLSQDVDIFKRASVSSLPSVSSYYIMT